MNRISARLRITFGLVALLGSTLILAIAFGLIPSQREAIMEGRARFCEAIAVSSSALASRDDVEALKATLQGFASRDQSLISAAVRKTNGKVVAVVGDHLNAWYDFTAAKTGDSKVLVPIYAGKDPWGTVEVRFRPVTRTGVLGVLMRPSLLLCVFVISVSFIAFLLYLRKVLQHLDPSKVVPGRVRSALDTLAEGLLVLDDKERIVLANQAFADISGRSSESLLGTRASQLPWNDREGEKPWTISIHQGEPQRNVMLQLRDATGQMRTFVVNCSPVQGHNGKNRGVLVSLEDVTELEAQKVELSKSKEAAESANKAKSEFLARMSHEIRTPMNAIIGFADVLRRGFDESEAERQEYLETIHSSGQHLLELINDILDLSKIESGRIQLEMARCSPHQIISEVVNVLRGKAKQKNITLEYRWDGKVPQTILTDPTRLRQVLTNLAGNAIKFTEKGGVNLVARVVEQDGVSKLAVDVIDTGIGIRQESVENLFQPFAQADTSITRRFGGTGLGLTISRQLAQAMGGDITLASEFGKGSTFTCIVDTGPLEGVALLAAPPTVLRTQENGALPTRLPPLRVLSVDDGPSNQKLIALVLRRAGVAQVDTAENGKVGVELALRNKYDIILMDMQMPVMDGFTAVGELRKAGLTLPVIALTAHAMKTEEERCLAAGCTGFLSKPIDMDRLVEVVAEQAAQEREISTGPLRDTFYAIEDEVDSPPLGSDSIQSTLPTEDQDFREVVVEFIDRLHEQLAAMKVAWEERELSQIAELAHWLKGSGGTAGFGAFTAPAKRLEQLVKEQSTDEIEQAIAELQQLASRVVSPDAQTKPNRVEGQHVR